jgi:hypothetical protein
MRLAANSCLVLLVMIVHVQRLHEALAHSMLGRTDWQLEDTNWNPVT